jgi:hypothetical protein
MKLDSKRQRGGGGVFPLCDTSTGAVRPLVPTEHAELSFRYTWAGLPGHTSYKTYAVSLSARVIWPGSASDCTEYSSAVAANSAVERQLHPTPQSGVAHCRATEEVLTIHEDVVGLLPQTRSFTHIEAVPHTSTSPDRSAMAGI